MADDGRRAWRAGVRNALAWGVVWGAASFAVFLVRWLAGRAPAGIDPIDGLGMSIKFAVVGTLAGAAFSAFLRLAWRGRRLAEISPVRFGLAGAVVAGLFVPLLLQAMNVLGGGDPVAWALIDGDAFWSALFGGVAAGGSLWVAQRAHALPGTSGRDRLEGGASATPEFPPTSMEAP
jgi:hypothetical protein